MPATFAHPAAILPIRRLLGRRGDLVALVIGSAAPDFGYYVHRFDVATYAHTTAGSLVVCVPSGCIAYAVFRAMRAQLCYFLPQPHRSALMPLATKRLEPHVGRLVGIVWSILLGAWTHIIWDSFTHANGGAVQQFAVLRDTVWRIGNAELPAYHLLQHGSTIVGTLILAYAYATWLRRHRAAATFPDALSERTRYLLLVALTVISFGIAIPFAVSAAAPFDGYLAVRVFVFRTALYAIATFIPLFVGTAIVLDRLRTRANEIDNRGQKRGP